MMIIYIVGYGRSGSTRLSQLLEKKLNAANLGEVKYLYRDDKNDLLDSFWVDFKKNNTDIQKLSDDLMGFDSLFGVCKWGQRNRFKKYWLEIFDRIGLDLKKDIIIDSSKTTLDSYMRGIYLQQSFNDVYFLQVKRNFSDIFISLLNGKNSDLERGARKGYFKRLIQVLFISLPHLIITKIITQVYRIYGLHTFDITNLETEVEQFLNKNGFKPSNSKINIPMIYGNRSRNREVGCL